MTNKIPKTNIRKKTIRVAKVPRPVVLKDTTAIDKKVVITSGDRNSQVLAATVGGAVLGNLIAPGIGGAIFGGLVGALLGNDSLGKGRK